MKTENQQVITLENLIENTLKVTNKSENLDKKAETLKKILKRDAYFLEQEK